MSRRRATVVAGLMVGSAIILGAAAIMKVASRSSAVPNVLGVMLEPWAERVLSGLFVGTEALIAACLVVGLWPRAINTVLILFGLCGFLYHVFALTAGTRQCACFGAETSTHVAAAACVWIAVSGAMAVRGLSLPKTRADRDSGYPRRA